MSGNRWVREGARAARADWVLEEERRRERATLFRALRELVPEYVVQVHKQALASWRKVFIAARRFSRCLLVALVES